MRRSPLPEVLGSRVFTRTEAVECGLTAKRLRARDVTRAGYGVYHPADLQPTFLELARPICEQLTGSWVSHGSGLTVRGLWLPDRAIDPRLHLSRLPPGKAIRRDGVVGHQARVVAGEVDRIDGVPVSTPARCWLELSQYLDEDDLIHLGDHLVRIPRPGFEGRTTPYTTIAHLRALHAAHRHRAGSLAAARALDQIRVGADSVPETRFRLAIVRAGLPEPETQVALDPSDPFSPTADLGYRAYRIALQYDGATHLDAARQSRDNRRDAAFSLAGWKVVKANRDDLADEFSRVIEGLRAVLGTNSQRGMQ